MNRKNEEMQCASSVTFRVPNFVSEDGTVFSDIEITISSDGDLRDVVNLTKTLEEASHG
jgi:hypothetical protein